MLNDDVVASMLCEKFPLPTDYEGGAIADGLYTVFTQESEVFIQWTPRFFVVWFSWCNFAHETNELKLNFQILPRSAKTKSFNSKNNEKMISLLSAFHFLFVHLHVSSLFLCQNKT